MADPQSRSGARYSDTGILQFVDRVHAPHDPALATAYAAADGERLPAIQVGPSEGKLLGLLAKLIGARRIVEIGTLAGYSALRMARALPTGGKLWTLEIEPQHASEARRNIAQAGLADRVDVLQGAALDLLPALSAHGPFDMVFLDADKTSYPAYAAWAADHLRPGGLLIADNAYYFGKLLADTEDAAQLRRFHAQVAERFDSVCIPTPDGMLVAMRS